MTFVPATNTNGCFCTQTILFTDDPAILEDESRLNHIYNPYEMLATGGCDLHEIDELDESIGVLFLDGGETKAMGRDGEPLTERPQTSSSAGRRAGRRVSTLQGGA